MSEETKAAPRFVGGRERQTTVFLDWPVEYDGKICDSVTIKRLTAREVADWQKSLAALPDDVRVRFPIYCDVQGVDLPTDILDALDDDDWLKIEKAALDFLPQRFRAAPAGGSALNTGADTGPSSEK